MQKSKAKRSYKGQYRTMSDLVMPMLQLFQTLEVYAALKFSRHGNFSYNKSLAVDAHPHISKPKLFELFDTLNGGNSFCSKFNKNH